MSHHQNNRFNSILLTAAILIGGSAFLYMVYIMSQIASHMNTMTTQMVEMSRDVSGMHEHLSIMVTEVSKIDDVVLHMDENMNAMNTQVTLIQNSISEDMKLVSESVESLSISLLNMDKNVGFISFDVNRMSHMMGGMSYDIHKGTESFTSPMEYLQNMRP